ncbi:hypothetical protein ACHAXR_012389 [Thalassiosira sp. AJA248-18]
MPVFTSDHNQDDHSNSGKSVASRVRVLPSSSLALPTPPSPPLAPPPKPLHLCKIAVVGDPYSGKSSLIQKFIHRIYANHNAVNENRGEKCDGGGTNNTNGAASATSNSITTSLGATTFDGLESTLAEYHKKDVTIWYNSSQESKSAPSCRDGNNEAPVCVRVQLWDMNVHQHFTNQQNNESDVHSIHSASSSLVPPGHNTNIAPLLPLLKRINGMMIVYRCPLPPSSSFSHSSNASYASHASNASCSEWPELDLLEQRIRQWTKYLRDQLNYEKQQRPSIFVLLSCADLAIADYSPKQWMQLSVRMKDVCNNCEIDSWKMGTCMDNRSSDIDEGYSQNHQSKLLQRMMEQQRQMLEDMEDAIEASFIDMISMHLGRSRERHKHRS